MLLVYCDVYWYKNQYWQDHYDAVKIANKALESKQAITEKLLESTGNHRVQVQVQQTALEKV